MKLKLFLLAALASLAVTAVAEARVASLSIPKARTKAQTVALRMFNGLADRGEVMTDYGVDSCSRRSARVVDCDYWVESASDDDYSTIHCDDTVRVRLNPRSGRLSYTFPFKPECY